MRMTVEAIENAWNEAASYKKHDANIIQLVAKSGDHRRVVGDRVICARHTKA